jgi:hypothetical protein
LEVQVQTFLHPDTKTFTATAEGAVTQYHVLKRGTDPSYQVATSGAATDVPAGVAPAAAATGTLLPVVRFGPAYVIAAAPITAGAAIQSNGDGKVKTLVATGYSLGWAEEAAAADGDVIKAWIQMSMIPKA